MQKIASQIANTVWEKIARDPTVGEQVALGLSGPMAPVTGAAMAPEGKSLSALGRTLGGGAAGVAGGVTTGKALVGLLNLLKKRPITVGGIPLGQAAGLAGGLAGGTLGANLGYRSAID